jgi:glycosidase
VEGFENERLFNFLSVNGVDDIEKRTKLAFCCLLTAVGLPMVLAGDEFADQHDLFDARGRVTQDGGKQVDPVNFTRLNDDWRRRVVEQVARLVRLRTGYPALAVNDIDFIHVDFNDDKRVMVWRRGRPGDADQVVVVANFSDFATANGSSDPNAEYFVPNWPATPNGRQWREVTRDRDAPNAGREPIFAWEAKVYALF